VSSSPDSARIRVSWQALTLALVEALAAVMLMVVPAHAAISNYYVNCRRNFEYKDSGGTWRLGSYTVEVRVSVDTAQSNKIVGGPWLNRVSVSPSTIRENVTESYWRSGQTVYLRASGYMSNGASISCSKTQTVG